MSELKRTVLYQAHLDAGVTMVDFGGWDMPIQYPEGIIAEHLYCRRHCGIFDVSHMGRIDVEGPDQVAFLQHVLSSNVLALDLNQAQYCIIPDQNGCAIDDAYLYRFEAEKYFLVINAGNIDKDLAHLTREAERYNVTLTNVSDRYAAIAVQGPEAKKLLMTLSGGKALTRENVKNALGHLAYILEGINTISSIRAEHMVIEADGMSYEDDYIFGAISNSTSIAGILTLKPELVDMSDGLFEMLLIKAPRDLIELAEIVHMLTTQNYESDMLTFVNASEFLIHASAETSWTLDGEYQEGCEEIKVENLHHAINLMMR